MSTKVYVGNLPYTTTEEELQSLFSEAGTVIAATIIVDKFSGRSRGFGFVEMSSGEEAEKAIALMNGRAMQDRELVVNEARERSEGSRRPGPGESRE